MHYFSWSRDYPSAYIHVICFTHRLPSTTLSPSSSFPLSPFSLSPLPPFPPSPQPSSGRSVLVEGVDEEDEEEQQRFEEQLQQWRKTEVGGGDRGGVRVRVVT